MLYPKSEDERLRGESEAGWEMQQEEQKLREAIEREKEEEKERVHQNEQRQIEDQHRQRLNDYENKRRARVEAQYNTELAAYEHAKQSGLPVGNPPVDPFLEEKRAGMVIALVIFVFCVIGGIYNLVNVASTNGIGALTVGDFLVGFAGGFFAFGIGVGALLALAPYWEGIAMITLIGSLIYFFN